MRLLRKRVTAEVVHAARVALAATLLVGIVYAACVAVLDQVVSARLVQAAKARLEERLGDVAEAGLRASRTDDDDLDAAPVYLWRVTPAGPVAQTGAGTPSLPTALPGTAGRRWTLS